MTRSFLSGAIVLTALLITPAVAETSNTQATKIESTIRDAAAASAWNLTETEWQRYQEIQAGPRGIWSPALDPITSLGVSADTEAERRRYAELFVEIEKQRVEKELAFEREISAAWKRLYPNLLPIQPSNQGAGLVSPSEQGVGRLLVFVCASCNSCTTSVGNLVSNGTAFDLFMVGSRKDDQVIRQWAESVGIPPDRVRSRQITLNHDNGEWLDLGGLTGTLPAAFKRAGEQWLPVDL